MVQILQSGGNRAIQLESLGMELGYTTDGDQQVLAVVVCVFNLISTCGMCVVKCVDFPYQGSPSLSALQTKFSQSSSNMRNPLSRAGRSVGSWM